MLEVAVVVASEACGQGKFEQRRLHSANSEVKIDRGHFGAGKQKWIKFSHWWEAPVPYLPCLIDSKALALHAARRTCRIKMPKRACRTRQLERDKRPPTQPVAMPTAKRQKKSAASQSQKNQPPPTPVEPVAEGESEFAQLAKQHWLKPSKKATKVKVKNDVLKQNIWDPLERDKFPLSSLLALEGLQILER